MNAFHSLSRAATHNAFEPGAVSFCRRLKMAQNRAATVIVPMSAGDKFEQLVSIMARLRAPGGCPWDREQTFDTIKPFLLEETYEVMQAIDARDWPELAEELGALLLQVVFFSEMAAEAGHFNIEQPIDAINAKLI